MKLTFHSLVIDPSWVDDSLEEHSVMCIPVSCHSALNVFPLYSAV